MLSSEFDISKAVEAIDAPYRDALGQCQDGFLDIYFAEEAIQSETQIEGPFVSLFIEDLLQSNKLKVREFCPLSFRDTNSLVVIREGFRQDFFPAASTYETQRMLGMTVRTMDCLNYETLKRSWEVSHLIGVEAGVEAGVHRNLRWQSTFLIRWIDLVLNIDRMRGIDELVLSKKRPKRRKDETNVLEGLARIFIKNSKTKVSFDELHSYLKEAADSNGLSADEKTLWNIAKDVIDKLE